MKNKRILFTGGGTAGHVIVNLALIPTFYKEGWEIDYIGSKDGIEKELIAQLDYVTYHSISTGKLRRYMSKENFKDPFKVLKGIFQSWSIMGKRKPRIIFSKGGFVSVPVILASRLRGIPAIIHESDYTPGLANKLAIPFAKKVLATFEETLEYLPEKKREYIGAIVRKELFEGNKKSGLDFLKFTTEKPVLLIMGGSGGSERINESVHKGLPELLKTFQVVHICGKDKIDEEYKQAGYVQYEYINEELNNIFAATDYVLSRAGANSIFEFLSLRIPMLLVPLGLQASRGDQIVNAKSFADKGYARVIEDASLTTEVLVNELKELKDHAPSMIDQMKSYNSESARDEALRIIKNLMN